MIPRTSEKKNLQKVHLESGSPQESNQLGVAENYRSEEKGM